MSLSRTDKKKAPLRVGLVFAFENHLLTVRVSAPSCRAAMTSAPAAVAPAAVAPFHLRTHAAVAVLGRRRFIHQATQEKRSNHGQRKKEFSHYQ
jgi:hypothetical protein